jgi:drug/metabolite transporter (DMT)-like permease
VPTVRADEGDADVVTVVVLVVLAALANACALVLLRKAVLDDSAAPWFSLRQLWSLLHRPVWAGGMATIFIGFALQATALSIGAVSAVQLIIILELPFTLILGSFVLGGSLRVGEWTAVATMTLGVALLLSMLDPQGGDPYSTGLTVWILAALLTVAVIAGLVLLGRRRDGAAKAALMGVATGMASGLIAVLTNAVLTAAVGGGIRGVFTTWWTYLLILTVPVGFFLLQGALQAGRLVASQPGITLANPLVAAVWGIGIFGEHVRTGAWLIGALLGAVLIGGWCGAALPLSAAPTAAAALARDARAAWAWLLANALIRRGDRLLGTHKVQRRATRRACQCSKGLGETRRNRATRKATVAKRAEQGAVEPGQLGVGWCRRSTVAS